MPNNAAEATIEIANPIPKLKPGDILQPVVEHRVVYLDVKVLDKLDRYIVTKHSSKMLVIARPHKTKFEELIFQRVNK